MYRVVMHQNSAELRKKGDCHKNMVFTRKDSTKAQGVEFGTLRTTRLLKILYHRLSVYRNILLKQLLR